MSKTSKIKAHLDNIALSHSVFALPFAYMGAFLAKGSCPSLPGLFYITLAMVGARSAALALNNLIDLKYDKIHPRFTKRPMVTGTIKPFEVIILIIISLSVFLFAASNLAPICLTLWPFALIPLVLYPYMKRISFLCHFVLGLALSIAPIGAWAAITNEISWEILFLGLAVAVWIAGFDIIYGCQDTAFDRENNLHSVPADFGIKKALIISKLLHVISIMSFVIAGYMLTLNFIYFIGVFAASMVLIYQHKIISEDDLSKVTQRYFMRNGLVSIFLFISTVISLYFY